MRYFLTIVVVMLASVVAWAEKSYNIAEIYEVEKPASGTKAVGKYDKVVEVQLILTPTKIEKGKYVVEVKKIGDNLYQIKNSDICIETRYCHEWASTPKEVVLIIESTYGYNRGKIIF